MAVATLVILSAMTPLKRILLVDDLTPLRQSLIDHLRLGGDFEIDGADTGGDALARVGGGGYDAIIIESRLSDMAGRDLARRLRDEGACCPLILLALPEGEAGSGGPESDGIDVVVKPFRIGVLLALLRTRVRDTNRDQAAVFPVGHYMFRPVAKLLVDEARAHTVRLTEKETAILSHLCRAGRAVTTREVLLGAIWGYQAGVDTHTLETHIYRLRRKIEHDPANAQILITEPGGYRLGG